MKKENDGKCGECAESIGTTSKAWVYCFSVEKQVLRDKVEPCFKCKACKRDEK